MIYILLIPSDLLGGSQLERYIWCIGQEPPRLPGPPGPEGPRPVSKCLSALDGHCFVLLAFLVSCYMLLSF